MVARDLKKGKTLRPVGLMTQKPPCNICRGSVVVQCKVKYDLPIPNLTVVKDKSISY